MQTLLVYTLCDLMIFLSIGALYGINSCAADIARRLCGRSKN